MGSFETKKLALIRILQILQKYSDYDHPLTQLEIANHLYSEYGIEIERKAIGRNISLLKEAGFEIESSKNGCYLSIRDFEDSELHMLIDGILSSKYITSSHSLDLINRICNLSNKYFKSNVKYIHSVNNWNKTDNKELFYNIELIDEAIEKGYQIHYEYNKYGIDKKLHKSSQQCISPYQMILNNQRYYIMGYSDYWGHIVFHRIDRIKNMSITEEKALPITQVPGYERGIDYKKISSSLPYLFSDNVEDIEFISETWAIDQIIDWFGTDIKIESKQNDENKIIVKLKASPNAMEHWAMQYINSIEIVKPVELRNRIKTLLEESLTKYK